MTTILYAAPFDAEQLKRLRLPDPQNEYSAFRALLGMLSPKTPAGQPRFPTALELDVFCEKLAHRKFEPVGNTGLYRHATISDLCCMIMEKGNSIHVVPGNNVMMFRGDAFQWTFFQKGATTADDRVKVINGGNASKAMPPPAWVPRADADRIFGEAVQNAGQNIVALNLKRGGTRIPNLPASAYTPG